MIPKVLIVDDEEANLSYLRQALGAYADRFQVVTAHDGLDALEKLRSENVQMVVTDLRMPRLDGFGLLLRLVESYPRIPRVVMTSLNSPVTQYQAERSDILDYLIKPFDASILAKRILATVENRKESGYLKGISVASFAQLVDLEQKTCTIMVKNNKDGRTGELFFQEGRLLDAKVGNQNGIQAACLILVWPDTEITMQDRCPEMTDNIRRKVHDLLIMSAKAYDELSAGDEPGTAAAQPAPPPTVAPAPAPAPSYAGVDSGDLQDQAFDAFRTGRFETARACFQELNRRTPGVRMIEYNLRLAEEKMRKGG